MKKSLVLLRDKICYDTWERYKSAYSAEELAQIFNLELKNFYRITNEQTRRKEDKN